MPVINIQSISATVSTFGFMMLLGWLCQDIPQFNNHANIAQFLKLTNTWDARTKQNESLNIPVNQAQSNSQASEPTKSGRWIKPSHMYTSLDMHVDPMRKNSKILLKKKVYFETHIFCNRI